MEPFAIEKEHIDQEKNNLQSTWEDPFKNKESL